MVKQYINNNSSFVVQYSDFKNHYDGYDFSHDISHITISDPIIFNSNPYTSLSDLLSAVSTDGLSAEISNATSLVAGGVILTSDLAGTYDSPKVVKLQNIPVVATIPTSNQVLTFNSDSNSWEPAAPVTFVAGSDLQGSISDQKVSSISGDVSTSIVSYKAQGVNAEMTSVVKFTQTAQTLAQDGYDTIFVAQSSNNGSFKGGSIGLFSGTSLTGFGDDGYFTYGFDYTDPSTWSFQISQPSGGKVISLGVPSSGILDNTMMPANSGDNVIYIPDATTAPTVSANSGAIMFSEDGYLKVMHEGGNPFAIGDLPNPYIFDGYNARTVHYRNVIATLGTTSVEVYRITLEEKQVIRVEAVVVAKDALATVNQTYRIEGAYVKRSGTNFEIDPIELNGIPSSSVMTADPSINYAGTDLIFYTGNLSGSEVVTWVFDFKIVYLD